MRAKTRFLSLGGLPLAALAISLLLLPAHHRAPLQPVAADVALAPAPHRTTTTSTSVARARKSVVVVPVTRPYMSPTTRKSAPVTRKVVPVTESAGGWNSTFQCVIDHESGGNWSENTGNGYYGAGQWLPSTWNSAARGAGYGGYGDGRADLAPASVQMAVMVYWQHVAGWGQWPQTSRECGV